MSEENSQRPPEAERPYVGGQAVIEGVMMRSPHAMAIAVRRSDGSIVLRQDAWDPVLAKLKFLRWPFLRGSLVLIESMWNGVQALHFSAEQADAEVPKPSAGRVVRSVLLAPAIAATGPAPMAAKGGAALAASIVLSLVFAFGLFKGLPHFLTWGAGKLFGIELGVSDPAFHVVDGTFKLGIFIGYVVMIGRLEEIRRVFQYHGAEHKSINAYEHNESLTVANARKHTTFHARCGTSFVLFVILLSVVIFAVAFPFVPKLSENALLNQLGMLFIKIPLMFPVAGLAYEINRFASRHPGSVLVSWMVSPGRMMQKLTTREPTDDQLEIALAAMRAALDQEAKMSGPSAPRHSDHSIVVFNGFREVEAALPEAA
ncbi:MAG: DUF1385 domain-containing protein [Deltaproteobacteria bacterium]|nr:DUF1385 domain-containing protein [Deltaproteobacteria bacterium]